MSKLVNLDSQTIFGFSESLLKSNFEEPKPTPQLHHQLWAHYCSDNKLVADAAPRSHAKSTAVTHTCSLATVLFRVRDFGLIVSGTEAQAMMFLGDIRAELTENDKLRKLFGISHLEKETESDLIVKCTDGHRFRLMAKGSGQSLRGVKWRGKRPGFIICDDLETDDIVNTKETREKFKRWFNASLVPCLSPSGFLRVVGTILHMDSLLENIMGDGSWSSHRYKAHNKDYSEILWEEQYDEEALRAIKTRFVSQGLSDLYSQEYLNYPIDEENAMFKLSHLKGIKDPDEPLEYYAAADFAITQKSYSDYTVIAVCGISPSNQMKIVDIRRGRWDAFEIVEEMMSVQRDYSPEMFTVEKGAIEKSLGPALELAQREASLWIDLNPKTPDTDKVKRAKSFAVRVRRGAVEFDTEAHWWDDAVDELTRFPKAKHDDIVDALSWLGLTVDSYNEARTYKEQEEEDWEDEINLTFDSTANSITGY